MSKNPSDIEDDFTYHTPNPRQKILYEEIRNVAKSFAHCIADHCPDSKEASLAYTKLRESVMWANASIALNTKENN